MSDDVAGPLRALADLFIQHPDKDLVIVLDAGPEPANGVRAYLGEYADHLYTTCPALRGRTPRLAQDLVDPLGEDLCGWCQRVWRARNREPA